MEEAAELSDYLPLSFRSATVFVCKTVVGLRRLTRRHVFGFPSAGGPAL